MYIPHRSWKTVALSKTAHARVGIIEKEIKLQMILFFTHAYIPYYRSWKTVALSKTAHNRVVIIEQEIKQQMILFFTHAYIPYCRSWKTVAINKAANPPIFRFWWLE